MGESPLLTPSVPRIAPPQIHTRTPSRSPTRQRLADDLLSDLTPTTIFEAFTSPSGQLKASIDVATPSERAFGLRAALASKKIQEWVDELSQWPWPAEGGSTGFEVPAAKRRKLSAPSADSNLYHNGDENVGSSRSIQQEYIGSLLSVQLERYENRIDEITADMEELNVEEIKRQVLDTHFSSKSRPSSSASSAPMPSLFASYTKMEDFTAIVTATVLQALPNLSRLTRLMDVWSIRLSVLRKVPPLLLALDDAEIALKSGWNAINNPGYISTQGNRQQKSETLSRDTFGIMRDILQEKVTTLGQDLDFMLDTLEGREDTLPDSWLDRMEAIEQNYGEWVVSGDRKVTEGEWIAIAKARKAEEDARKLKEAEAARRMAEEEAARRKALEEAKQAEAVRRMAEEETTRRKALEEAEAAEAARRVAEDEAARRKALEEAQQAEVARRVAEEEAARRKALEEAEQAEVARRVAEEAARRKAQDEAEAAEAARRAAEEEAARRKAQEEAEEAETARRVAEEVSRRKAQEEAEEAEAARRAAEEEAARRSAQEEAETARRVAEEEAARRRAQKEAEEAETASRIAVEEAARRKAQEEAEEAEAATRVAEEEAARIKAQKEAEEVGASRQKVVAEEVAQMKTQKEAEEAEIARPKEEEDVARLKAQKDAEDAEIARRKTVEEEATRIKARKDAEELEDLVQKKEEDATRIAQKEAEEAETARREAEDTVAAAEIARLTAEDNAVEAEDNVVEAEVAGAVNRIAEQDGEIGRAQTQNAARAGDITKSEALSNTKEAEIDTSEGASHGKMRHEGLFKDIRALSDQNAGDKIINSSMLNGTKATAVEFRQAAGETFVGPISSTASTPVFISGTALASADFSTKSATNDSSQKRAYGIFDGNNSEDSERNSSLILGVENTLQNNVKSVSTNHSADDPQEVERGLASPIHFYDVSPEAHISRAPEPPAHISDPVEGSQGHEVLRFGHKFPNDVRSSQMANDGEPFKASGASHMDYAFLPEKISDSSDGFALQTPSGSSIMNDIGGKDSARTKDLNEEDWTVIENPDLVQTPYSIIQDEKPSDYEHRFNPDDETTADSGHARSISFVSSYSISSPSPEIHTAEPAEYFKPAVSPVQSVYSRIEPKEPITPSKLMLGVSPTVAVGLVSPPRESLETPTEQFLEPTEPSEQNTPVAKEKLLGQPHIDTADGICEVCDKVSEATSISAPTLSQQPSTTGINTEIKHISIPRMESFSSDTPTITTDHADDIRSSPLTTPTSVSGVLDPFPEVDEDSPSAGRVGLRNRISYDYTPPGSPPPIPARANRGLRLEGTDFLDSDPTEPSTPLEPPLLDNVDISSAPLLSSPKKTSSDEQLQKQISSLLESIPARIHLTSELEPAPVKSGTLHPKKTRRSITPSVRSSSSMSNHSTYSSYSRAPTPSFTLAPAFSKTTQRSRTPGNPEIKLYHLSRSTGEAPIKLFVRLVGEHGERVMVRVGGGWADLGEYLKEYASHHGRRTAADNDKVEIQDLPSRVVSTGSTISSNATLRGNGRSTPVSRPQSVMERPMDRPGSSLNVRKTRKSVGESEPFSFRSSDLRSPSTPLPSVNRRPFETPPSAAGSEASSASGTGPTYSARSSSRLSWTDEDSSLGLAGPKGKKVMISERDQEWVESMKEKVRLASAEKERKEKVAVRESERKTSFGEMDKIGGTKRLFRKGGV